MQTYFLSLKVLINGTRFLSSQVSKFNPSSFDSPGNGNSNLLALSLEQITLLFAYYTLDTDLSQLNSSKTIEIEIYSTSYSKIVELIKVDVILQSYVVHRTFHFYEPEKSSIRKSLYFVQSDSSITSTKYVHGIEPVTNSDRKSRGFVNWKQEKNCICIDLLYKCSSYPQNGKFLIFIYDDQFRLKLSEVAIVLDSNYIYFILSLF